MNPSLKVICDMPEIKIFKMNDSEEILQNQNLLDFYKDLLQDLLINTQYVQEWWKNAEYINNKGEITSEALVELIKFFQIDPYKKNNEIGGIYNIKGGQKNENIGFVSIRLDIEKNFEISYYLYDKIQKNKNGVSFMIQIILYLIDSEYLKKNSTENLYITIKSHNRAIISIMTLFNKYLGTDVFELIHKIAGYYFYRINQQSCVTALEKLNNPHLGKIEQSNSDLKANKTNNFKFFIKTQKEQDKKFLYKLSLNKFRINYLDNNFPKF